MSRNKLLTGLLAAWLLVVAVALFAIVQHEQTLRHGELVLLRLAPVDPRSLMQGDYMALRFAADRHLRSLSAAPHGVTEAKPVFAHFMLDEQGRATFDALGDTPRSEPGKISMRIRRSNGQPTLGPNAFFFQEGTGTLFEAAQWGGFRVAHDGTALLVSLHDAGLQKIGVQQR